MIRKTRLLTKAGVMLVRVETFQDGDLRSTRFRLETPVASRTFATQTFSTLTAAIRGFRVATRRPTETARLKAAA